MTNFRWGEPYRFPAGTMYGDSERLGEACRGLYLRCLVLIRRGLRRAGIWPQRPQPKER